MQHTEHLTAVIEREGDGFVALCPEFDIASQGDSVEDATGNLREALGYSSRPPAQTKFRSGCIARSM
jgi:hypothetical protein